MDSISSSTTNPDLPAASWAEPPGGILVWMIVVVELLTFGMGLVVFLVQAGENTELFQRGRASLNQPIGMLNTLVLLTGGWFMTKVVGNLRSDQAVAAGRWLMAAIVSGAAFLLLKGFEYHDKLDHGLDLNFDTFFTLYWLLTGFHFVHVAVAVILLVIMWRGLKKGHYTAGHHEDIESSGVFWHMCDLIWLLLYPAIYLLR